MQKKKTFKYVGAFGDSFTWGTDLKDTLSNEEYVKKYGKRKHKKYDPYSKHTWPALLTKDLSIDLNNYINHSRPGYTNQSIARKFFKVLCDEQDKLNENMLVILNWTWINRWEFYDAEKDKWYMMRPSGSSKKELHNIYFKYMQSEVWDKWESLKSIALVHKTLKERNIKFIATCVDKLIIDKEYNAPNYVQSLQDEISRDLLWFDNKGFYDWAKENDFPISKEGGHPLEESHQAAFEYIKENCEFTK
jgi:hypothetical protein